MDLNTLRSLVTVLSFVMFLGIIAWTFSRRRGESFDEAAMLPFRDDSATQGGVVLAGMSRHGGGHE